MYFLNDEARVGFLGSFYSLFSRSVDELTTFYISDGLTTFFIFC